MKKKTKQNKQTNKQRKEKKYPKQQLNLAAAKNIAYISEVLLIVQTNPLSKITVSITTRTDIKIFWP